MCRASERCNLVTCHWAARTPSRSVAAAQEGISIYGSHCSLLIHPDPSSNQFSDGFFADFFRAASPPTQASAVGSMVSNTD